MDRGEPSQQSFCHDDTAGKIGSFMHKIQKKLSEYWCRLPNFDLGKCGMTSCLPIRKNYSTPVQVSNSFENEERQEQAEGEVRKTTRGSESKAAGSLGHGPLSPTVMTEIKQPLVTEVIAQNGLSKTGSALDFTEHIREGDQKGQTKGSGPAKIIVSEKIVRKTIITETTLLLDQRKQVHAQETADHSGSNKTSEITTEKGKALQHPDDHDNHGEGNVVAALSLTEMNRSLPSIPVQPQADDENLQVRLERKHARRRQPSAKGQSDRKRKDSDSVEKVLFAGNDSGKTFGSQRNVFQRRLSESFAELAHWQAYSASLEQHDQPITKDEETGGFLIHPDGRKLIKLERRDPTLDWLIQHESLYPHLKDIHPVKIVVAFLSQDEDLVDVGFDWKESIFPGAKLVLFNLAVIEDEKALKYAEMADTVFSVGRHVFDYFDRKYKARGIKETTHFCHYPLVTDEFMNINITIPSPNRVKCILTTANVKSQKDFDKYVAVTKAIGDVANVFDLNSSKPITWKIIGVDTDLIPEFQEFLNKMICSKMLQIDVKDTKFINDFKNYILESDLYIAPEKTQSFSQSAFLAMQAGIPVLVPRCADIVSFIDELLNEEDHVRFISVDTSVNNSLIEEDCIAWEEVVRKRLLDCNINKNFSKASNLKQALKKCKLITSPQQFLDQLSADECCQ